jgi:hypothetical protein
MPIVPENEYQDRYLDPLRATGQDGRRAGNFGVEAARSLSAQRGAHARRIERRQAACADPMFAMSPAEWGGWTEFPNR